jgi:hypothetical protein
VLELYIDGRSVGFLHDGPDSDFPWFVGTFQPGEHFAAYEKLFQTLVDQDADGDRWLRVDLLEAHGLTTADLIVEEEAHTDDEPTFLHALKLCANGSAHWRIGLEPLPDGVGAEEV